MPALQYCIIGLSKQTVLIYHFHMHRGFADAELPGSGPHRGTVLYDVKRQPAGAFLDVPFQAATLLHSFTGGVYEVGRTDISVPAGKGLVM